MARGRWRGMGENLASTFHVVSRRAFISGKLTFKGVFYAVGVSSSNCGFIAFHSAELCTKGRSWSGSSSCSRATASRTTQAKRMRHKGQGGESSAVGSSGICLQLC